MPYVTSWERIAKEEGMEKGMEKKEWAVVRNALNIGLPLDTIAGITGLSVEKIKEMKLKISLEHASQIPDAGRTTSTAMENRA